MKVHPYVVMLEEAQKKLKEVEDLYKKGFCSKDHLQKISDEVHRLHMEVVVGIFR